MKKIVIILILIFTLSLVSCNKDKKEEENFEFIEKEKIVETLSTFYIKVEMLNVNGKTSTFRIVENENNVYYEFNDTLYLIEKENNILYSIDDESKIKLLEQQKEFDYQSNKNTVIDLLGEHIEKVDNSYQKSTNNVLVNDFNCISYESNKKVDNKNYSKSIYYVDDTLGFCFKQYSEVCSLGSKKVSSWEVKEYYTDALKIEQFFSKYDDYSIEIAPLEFDVWPTTGLGALLPECPNGKFMFGIDYGENALISVNEITLLQVKNYAATLVNYGFNPGKGGTNLGGQYVFITYNSDFVMVRLSFAPDDYSLAIKIIKSTEAEINKELSKI